MITNNKSCKANIFVNNVNRGELNAGTYVTLTEEQGFYQIRAEYSSIFCSNQSRGGDLECGGILNISFD